MSESTGPHTVNLKGKWKTSSALKWYEYTAQCPDMSHVRVTVIIYRALLRESKRYCQRGVCYVWTLWLVAGIVSRCCVVTCQNSVDEKPGLEFLKFLVSAERHLKRWTETLRRSVRQAKWKSKRYTVICSDHFLDGKLSLLFICICAWWSFCECVGNLIITLTIQSVWHTFNMYEKKNLQGRTKSSHWPCIDHQRTG